MKQPKLSIKLSYSLQVSLLFPILRITTEHEVRLTRGHPFCCLFGNVGPLIYCCDYKKWTDSLLSSRGFVYSITTVDYPSLFSIKGMATNYTSSQSVFKASTFSFTRLHLWPFQGHLKNRPLSVPQTKRIGTPKKALKKAFEITKTTLRTASSSPILFLKN